MWEYRATVIRHVDADTSQIRVDLGFSIYHEIRVRLLSSQGGVNAPEIHDKDPAERARARIAWARTAELAPPGSEVTVKTARDNRDGFGRYLAQIICADGTNVGDVLLSEGKAEVWTR